MAEKVVKLKADGYSLEQIQNTLGDNNACYVLITCSEPSADGKMNVEMSYNGDEVLAAYLVENAMQVFQESAKSEKSR